jgi:hypothetical protein
MPSASADGTPSSDRRDRGLHHARADDAPPETAPGLDERVAEPPEVLLVEWRVTLEPAMPAIALDEDAVHAGHHDQEPDHEVRGRTADHRHDRPCTIALRE